MSARARIARGALVAMLLASTVSMAPAFGQEAEHGAPAQAAEAEHAGGERAHVPAPINWTDFGCGPRAAGAEKPPPPFVATVVNFLLLMAILYMAVKRVINPALASRRAAVEAELGEAQRLRAEATALHREYTDRIANMEQEFAALRDEVVKGGELEARRILEEAKTRVIRMEREGTEAIQQEIKQLRNDLIHEAVDAASTAAEKAVRSGITPQDQTRLADEFVARLEKNPGASA